jgi:hypothetical protein
MDTHSVLMFGHSMACMTCFDFPLSIAAFIGHLAVVFYSAILLFLWDAEYLVGYQSAHSIQRRGLIGKITFMTLITGGNDTLDTILN